MFFFKVVTQENIFDIKPIDFSCVAYDIWDLVFQKSSYRQVQGFFMLYCPFSEEKLQILIHFSNIFLF